jgi:parvulin-like peptidyl-prolyl isomerase
MTVRLKPTNQPRRRRPADSEDQYTFRVTLAFIALIALVVLVVLVSVGIGYYNGHFRPIANVGNTSITRDQWAERVNLEAYRLGAQEKAVRAAIAANPADAARLNAILSDITSKLDAQTLADQSANDLLDLTFKEQLAAQNGVTVTDADVEAQMVKDASTPEERHVLAIEVEPKAVLDGADPTAQDKQTAYDNAQKAAAALAGGTPFDQVAETYSTDASKDKGGDLGLLVANDTTDPTWVDALFRLPLNGTTPVIKGDDGIYRIGMVTEIKLGVEDTSFRDGAIKAIGESAYRDESRREALADKLADKIVGDALGTMVDQVRLAEIFVAINGSDPAADVQIHASHILYSPNHDPSNTASLAPEDPAWATAEASADKTAAELNAITDITARTARFIEIAKSESDDKTSGAAGGELGTFTRDAMVEEFATPLFDNTDLKPGDIVGPVKSAFGWHVILFQSRIPSANDRLTATKDALAAAGADFATVARDHSDGDEALQGGELGWRTISQLPADVGTKVAATDVGVTTDPIQVDTGFYIEKVEEKAKRAPDGQQAAALAANAFSTWYADQKDQATKNKVIVLDSTIFTSSSDTGQ